MEMSTVFISFSRTGGVKLKLKEELKHIIDGGNMTEIYSILQFKIDG